ncbi:hypothetical protein E2C01_001532 [Portunus trituberculatus]|uniref:Uncharacterized protein n=1 Tax=Portunus trituberculatus TaxID=210409 RepID=A0A5B7CKN8_PORTR|nr:hypothetical protein [Portunus trituberculatus]
MLDTLLLSSNGGEILETSDMSSFAKISVSMTNKGVNVYPSIIALLAAETPHVHTKVRILGEAVCCDNSVKTSDGVVCILHTSNTPPTPHPTEERPLLMVTAGSSLCRVARLPDPFHANTSLALPCGPHSPLLTGCDERPVEPSSISHSFCDHVTTKIGKNNTAVLCQTSPPALQHHPGSRQDKPESPRKDIDKNKVHQVVFGITRQVLLGRKSKIQHNDARFGVA